MPTPHAPVESSVGELPPANAGLSWFAQAQAVPHLALGHTWHQRLAPRGHAFRYGVYFLLLPLRRLQADPSAWGDLPHNSRAPVAFFDADHGQGQGSALAWAEGLLQERGLYDSEGEIWLQTLPRMGRYAFKPVSFWYVLRSDHSLAAVLAEVNNTFGQRHVYVLHGPQRAFGLADALQAPSTPQTLAHCGRDPSGL